MKDKLVILGGGGHAKVLIDAIESSAGPSIAGILDPSLRKGKRISGYPVLGSDDMLAELRDIRLVNGVGTVKACERRKAVFEKCKKKSFVFSTVLHPGAYVAKTAKIGEGVQVLMGAVINAHARIGKDAIINTRAIIEHDCRIGGHAHVASGAILGGGVSVGECSHIGMGAKILQGVKIGRNATIGAGAVVTRDVADGKTVVGIPARER